MSETLVFLAGFLSDARLFGPQLTELSMERTIAIAPLLGATIEEMALNALEGLPQNFALVGHSLGGIVAMEMLRRAPERITRVALMDTNAQGETPSMAAAREPRIVGAKSGRFVDAVRDELRADYLADTPDRDEILALWQQMALDQGVDTFVRHSRAMQRRPDQQGTLRRARVPALLICGAQDELTPVRRHEFISTLMPRAELQVIEGAGHLPMLERPSAVTQALREWLDRPLLLR
ncbi:MAG: pimeloyl-ACP methyl ester carboxylesterase [Halocynthiibacter sp.]|jgi:pimeloyl-ACP methyl ester carboxylesterase